MAIYRGPGGSGDATGDSANQAQVAETFSIQAGVSAAAAAASATTASNAATAAGAAQTAAEAAQSAAETAETNAETAETNAETAQAAAEAAQAAAEAAQTAAELAETNAETAETNAETAQAAAEAAQSAAETAQTAAELAETNAETAESGALAAQAAAESARDSALAAYDNFDDRYLGAKASDPALDNDGNALVAGALYFNTVDNAMRVYTGSVWVDAYAAGTSFLAKANNLSDLPSAATARQNLDLEIGVDVQAYDATILKSADIGVTVQGYDATLLNDADIGVTVQAYDADTAKYDDATANFTGTLQNGGSNVLVDSDIGSTVQAYDSNLTSFVSTFTLPTTDGTADQVLKTNGSGTLSFVTPAAAIADGDKGDITVSSSGATWTIDDDAVTQSKIADAVYESFAFRNRIINGDMRIDQRNAGAAVTVGGSYPVDRFAIFNSTDAGAVTAQQDSSAPSGFSNSLKVTVTTADATVAATDRAGVFQQIEGFNTSDFGFGTASAKTVTFSFWVRSSLTGTFGGNLNNNGNNRSYIFNYTISSADTWEYKTIVIPGDTSGTWVGATNGKGVGIIFSFVAGTDFQGTVNTWNAANVHNTSGSVNVLGTLNATWYVTGVQLEVGSVATPFERRPYGQELSLCQRYYQVIGFPSSASDVNTMSFKGYNATGEYDLFSLSLLTQMRTDPTTTKVGTWAVTNCGQPGVTGQSQNSFSFQIQITSTGRYVATSNNSGYFTFSAEL